MPIETKSRAIEKGKGIRKEVIVVEKVLRPAAVVCDISRLLRQLVGMLSNSLPLLLEPLSR